MRPGEYNHIKAMRFIMNKEYDKAIKCYDEAIVEIKKAGNITEVPYFIISKGEVSYHKGDFDKAWKLFEEAIDLGLELKTFEPSLFVLSFLVNDAQLFDKAIKQTESIIDFVQTKEFTDLNDHTSKDFYLANAYANMGYCYCKLDMLFKAEKSLIMLCKIKRHGIISGADIDLCKFLIENERCIELAKDYIRGLAATYKKFSKDEKIPKELGEKGTSLLEQQNTDHINHLKEILEK